MLCKKNKYKISNTSEPMSINVNDYVIKIDYFDQKGTKNFENNIFLKDIFDSKIKLSKRI